MTRPEGQRRFATTRWSLILAVGESGTERSARALAELCSQYWPPLYSYARSRGHDAEDARDLTQAFFAKLLEEQALRAADPSRGRFRTFLLSSMKNFMTGEWRKQSALKRGGAVELVSLDFDAAEASYLVEPSHALSPEAIYQRKWALGLLERTGAALQAEYETAGKAELFDALKGVVAGGDEVLPYAELSKRLGRSEGALRTAATRLRTRWRERLRDVVAETVGDESEIEDELKSLITFVGGSV